MSEVCPEIHRAGALHQVGIPACNIPAINSWSCGPATRTFVAARTNAPAIALADRGTAANVAHRVKSSDLTRQQAEALKAQAARRLRWLSRLIARMDQLGFAPSDTLYQAALRARSGMHELHVAAIYAAVKLA